MKPVCYILLFCLSICFSPNALMAQNKLSLCPLFSDHMVLQQKAKIELWGESAPGDKITIATDWAINTTTNANSSGKWRVKLKTPAAGGPYTIRVVAQHDTLVVNDVLIGEVWLASGQSNMDIPLAGWPPGDTIANSKQEISKAKYPKIRFFKVPFKVAAKPLNTVMAKWDPITPENAGTYSATAYFYARRLQEVLGVPVGIIQSSIGGTPVEAWTSKSYLQKSGDFDETISRLDSIKLNSNSPTVLFNAMINPLIPYTIKGVIWYQGESNVGRAAQYKRLFPLMIQDWRNKWATELPFYFVQLAPYLYKDPKQSEQSQKLRDAQRRTLHLPRTGMVTTLDIGYLKTAHPPFKREVGERLAKFAFNNQYGLKQVTSGPLYKSTQVVENHLFVNFTSVGAGLQASKDGLNNFEIAGSDKVYVKASASFSADKVIVYHHSVPRPVYVRYAWSDSSKAAMFNKEGLPAATFTSEK